MDSDPFVSPISSLPSRVDKWSYGLTIVQITNKIHSSLIYALEHCYPVTFVSKSNDISTRLRVLLNDTLLNSAIRFGANVFTSQSVEHAPVYLY